MIVAVSAVLLADIWEELEHTVRNSQYYIR